MDTLRDNIKNIIYGLLMLGTLVNGTLHETELPENGPGVCFVEKSAARNRPRVYVKPIQSDENCVENCSNDLERIVIMESYLVKTNKTACCPGWYYVESDSGATCEPLIHEQVKNTWPWMYIVLGVLLSIIPIHAFAVLVTTSLLMSVEKRKSSKTPDVDTGKGYSTVACPSNILPCGDVHTTNDVKILTRNTKNLSAEETNISDNHIAMDESKNLQIKYPMKTNIVTKISNDMDPMLIELPLAMKTYPPMSNIEVPVKPYVSVEDMRIVYPVNTKQPDDDVNDNVKIADVTTLNESSKISIGSVNNTLMVYPETIILPKPKTKESLIASKYSAELQNHAKIANATTVKTVPAKKSSVSVEVTKIVNSEKPNQPASVTNNPQKAIEYSVELSDPIKIINNTKLNMQRPKTPFASISDMKIIYIDQSTNSLKETMDISTVDRVKTENSKTRTAVLETGIVYPEMKADLPLAKKIKVSYPSNILTPIDSPNIKREITYPSNYEDLFVTREFPQLE